MSKGKNIPATKEPSSPTGMGTPAVATEVISQTASVIPFLIKTFVVCGIIGFAYYKFTNRFVKKKYNSNYPASNVSDAQAEARANSIAKSIGWVSNDYDNVEAQLSGLNYNGFIKVYNAFGHQTGTLLGGKLDLVEWIRNQFTDYQIAKLSALLNGAFF